MIGESRFRGGSRISCPSSADGRARHDSVAALADKTMRLLLARFLGGFIEPAQGVEIIRQFENRVDIQSLAREFLRHGDAHDFSGVDLGDGERWLVRAKHLGDFRVKKKLKIGAERSLNAAKLLRRLFGIAAKCGHQFMRMLVALASRAFFIAKGGTVNRFRGAESMSFLGEFRRWEKCCGLAK